MQTFDKQSLSQRLRQIRKIPAHWARYKYSLFKFLVSVWMVPLIQLSALLFLRSRSAKEPVVLIITSRSKLMSQSFACLAPQLERAGVNVIYFSENHSKTRVLSKIRQIYAFFHACKYANFIFLDDTFLPVSYALKYKWLFRPRVVQIWHSAGLFKRVGLDVTKGRLATYLMKLNFRNFDLVVVSSEACRDAIAGFMGLERNKVVALGTSYTDRYFEAATDAKRQVINSDKRTLVYAPTFRGDAFKVEPSPAPQVARLLPQFESEFDCFISTHPHELIEFEQFKCYFALSDALGEIDVLITDYSSIAMDYMLANPDGRLVLFVPDLESYAPDVGFYVPLEWITPNIAYDEAGLQALLSSKLDDDYGAYREKYLTLCDGHATARLLEYLGLDQGKDRMR